MWTVVNPSTTSCNATLQLDDAGAASYLAGVTTAGARASDAAPVSAYPRSCPLRVAVRRGQTVNVTRQLSLLSTAARPSTSHCTASDERPAATGRGRAAAGSRPRRPCDGSASALRTCSSARESEARELRCVRPASSASVICTSRVAASSRSTSARSSAAPTPPRHRRPRTPPRGSSSSSKCKASDRRGTFHLFTSS